ncbi:unnamed protein product [Sphagnum jensenii]|uniref:TNFR-Cys domain-containing protein n=1 Tax=Sphagnum jensenii TaxID=128206 RepID=A0ABP0VFC4_9BRYO
MHMVATCSPGYYCGVNSCVLCPRNQFCPNSCTITRIPNGNITCASGYFSPIGSVGCCPSTGYGPQDTGLNFTAAGNLHDCYWSIVSEPTAETPFFAAPYNAYIFQSPNVKWTQNLPTGKWIGPSTNGQDTEAVGDYNYSTSFYLPVKSDYRCNYIPVTYSVDNFVVAVYLNGAIQFSCNASTCTNKYSSYFNLNIQTDFKYYNTLTVVVYQASANTVGPLYANPSGLLWSFGALSGCTCPAGSFNVGTGACQTCGSNYYQPAAGQGGCLPCTASCPSDYYEAAVCTTTADITCLPCQSPCLTCSGSSTTCTSCVVGYRLSGNKCIASSSPSALPTLRPTTSPSSWPTVAPSIVPTRAPSLRPTAIPSVINTAQPSLVSSTTPTILPSIIPTIHPTTPPSNYPTTAPSLAPTAVPFLSPSNLPTSISRVPPTAIPSVINTAQPSLVSSTTPTILPSIIPTIHPTTPPSSYQTTAPSLAPTAVPF